MLVCEARFGGCKTNFYHTDVESDDHFDPAKRGVTFIITFTVCIINNPLNMLL